MRVCIVSSCGGHLTEVRSLANAYEKFDYFYVVNHKIHLSDDMMGKTIFITHSERDWKFFLNLWEAFKILRRENPDVILSTGAGPAVPFAIVARIFFNIKIIYVETVTKITTPSLTGRIMYYLAHDFFYQWKRLEKFFPKGKYGGNLL